MKVKKQFAVIGLGRFGVSIARTLAKAGYEVLAIDNDEDRVQKLAEDVTHVAKADTTDAATLKQLGIRNFDVVVVAIGQDLEASVMTTMLVKEQGVKYIIAKAHNALHGKMLEKIGANRVVYPERDMGCRIAHNLISTNIIDYIELSPTLGIIEVNLPGSLVGRSLAEANLRNRFGINVVAINRQGAIIVSPLPNEQFTPCDVLVIIGDNEGIQQFEQLE